MSKKHVLIIVTGVIATISIMATFYRYLVIEDFTYESKPLEEFTEDDL